MPRKTRSPLPSVQRILRELGDQIRLARLRRRFSAILVAERAGIDPKTLRRVENGDPCATLGAYTAVLHVLGLEKDLTLVARDDVLGRKLQDAGLEIKKRAPKRRRALTSTTDTSGETSE
jgi:transcriptional regulator with XRE-family HTH domain